MVALSAALPASAITLTLSSILGGDSVSSGGTSFTLVEYSPAGAILNTLPLINGGPLGTMDGVAMIGGNVYVTGTGGVVGQVDLNTGNVFNTFAVAGSVESLGDLNGNLMVGNYSNGDINVYTPAGAFVQTISTPNFGMTGVDSDGTNIYVASYNNGNVYTIDLAGNVLSSFPTGAGGSSLSGLGYDSSTNSIWVSTGFNQDDIRQFSLTGTFITSFPTAPYGFIDGLDVVPKAIPEPSTYLMGSLVALGAVELRRRLKNANPAA